MSKHGLCFWHDVANHGPNERPKKATLSRRIVFYTSPWDSLTFSAERPFQTPKKAFLYPKSYYKGPNHASEKVLTSETPCFFLSKTLQHVHVSRYFSSIEFDPSRSSSPQIFHLLCVMENKSPISENSIFFLTRKFSSQSFPRCTAAFTDAFINNTQIIALVLTWSIFSLDDPVSVVCM